jgi:hypothetical protein
VPKKWNPQHPTRYTSLELVEKQTEKIRWFILAEPEKIFWVPNFPPNIFFVMSLAVREFQVAFIRNKKRKKRNVKTNDGRMALVKLFFISASNN